MGSTKRLSDVALFTILQHALSHVNAGDEDAAKRELEKVPPVQRMQVMRSLAKAIISKKSQ